MIGYAPLETRTANRHGGGADRGLLYHRDHRAAPTCSGAVRQVQRITGACRAIQRGQAAAGGEAATRPAPRRPRGREDRRVWRRLAARFPGAGGRQQLCPRGYDALFRFSPDGAKIEPKIAAGAEPSSDFRTWTVLLRKGARWSDGAPFTADDILFWYKDVLLNKDLTPALPGWIRNADGSPAKVEKVDDYTVRFSYNDPQHCF